VLSLTDTLEKVVSKTPAAKSATSMFEIELPVPFASKVLLVSVVVEPAVM